MKLGPPAYITLGNVREYGRPCKQGLSYLARQQLEHGPVRCNRETLERVLDDHPGCVVWLLDKLVERYAIHTLAGHRCVRARQALGELNSDVGAEARRCIEATGLWSKYDRAPTDVWCAVIMMCYLAHKDRIRTIALAYFNVPGTIDPKTQPERSDG